MTATVSPVATHSDTWGCQLRASDTRSVIAPVNSRLRAPPLSSCVDAELASTRKLSSWAEPISRARPLQKPCTGTRRAGQTDQLLLAKQQCYTDLGMQLPTPVRYTRGTTINPELSTTLGIDPQARVPSCRLPEAGASALTRVDRRQTRPEAGPLA